MAVRAGQGIGLIDLFLMKYDQRFFDSLDTGGGTTSKTPAYPSSRRRVETTVTRYVKSGPDTSLIVWLPIVLGGCENLDGC